MRKALGYLSCGRIFFAILMVAGICCGVCLCGRAGAQETSQVPSRLAAGGAVVPQVMRYTGVASGRAGDTVEATFRVYAGPAGGEALWSETQRVTVGADGRFSVLLGAASEGGLPQGIFSGGQGQWLGVSVERAEEQARVRLASVAYAMKAADAETLGGVAAGSFVTQAQLAATAAALTAQAAMGILPEATPSGSGVANKIAIWTSATTLGDSAVTQTGTTAPRIGINTGGPATTLDVNGAATVRSTLDLPASHAATAGAAANSPMLELGANSFNSGTAASVTNSFAWEAVGLGNDTTSPHANLNLMYIAGTAAPVWSGFSVGPTGLVTFGAGQTFPGTGKGTITGVLAGTGLTGGGTSGSVGLNLDTTMVPLLAFSNTFAADQTINGNLYVSGNVTLPGTVQAGQPPSVSYSTPDADGINTFSNVGAGIFAYSTQERAGIFESNNNQGSPFFQPNVGYYTPAVQAQNNGSGGALLARNSGYGTAAFVNSDGYSNVSQNQLAKYNAALWADSGVMNGIIGSSDGYNGGSFFNNSTGYATVLAKNFNTGGTSGLVSGGTPREFGTVIRAEGRGGVCGINTTGDVSCTGELKALAATQGGSHQVETYAVQSAESWLEDFGSGKLENGSAVVRLEATFADAANTGVEYHVFLTPKGDAQALYVTNETATGFEVHESAHGGDDIAFDYRIVARRRGHEAERLVDVTERFETERKAAAEAPRAPERRAVAEKH